MLVETKCTICKQPFQADSTLLKQGRKKTCSKECRYQAASRGNTKLKVAGTCAVCGEPVIRLPCQMKKSKASVMLCSRDCHYKARATGIVKRLVQKPYNIPDETRKAQAERQRQVNIRRKAEGTYAHTEGTKAKLSRAMSTLIAEGKVAHVSGLEKKVAAILTEFGISHVPQWGVRNPQGRFEAVVDFYLPEMKVAVEVNGTFWHTDPREYPDGPVKPAQKRVAEKYAKKMVLLAALNIPVVELWEMDLKRDLQGTVRAGLVQYSN